MVSSSTNGNLAARFAPYIDELRELFQGRHVPCGKPEDIRTLCERLGDPDFNEEMSSMVRSILYREGEIVPRVELMEVLAIAAGGPGIHDPALDLHESMTRLLDFVTKVARAQKSGLPREPGDPLFDQLTIADSTATTLDPDALSDQGNGRSPIQSRYLEGAEPRSINDRLSQALSYSQVTAERPDLSSQKSAEPPSRQLITTHHENAPSLGFVPDLPASTRSTGLRSLYWIPGVLLLLIAVGLVWALHRDPTTKSAPEPAPPASSQAVSQKPSPYVPGVSSRGLRSHTSASNRGAAAASEASETTATQATPAATGPAHNGTTARHAVDTPFKARGTQPSNPVVPIYKNGREGVFLASSGVMAGHLVSAPAPGYPKLATLARVEGEVIVQVVVGRGGEVEATRVLQGPRLLRSAAEHAVRRWRYRPYTVEGKPTDVATIVTVSFRLHR